LVAAEVLRGKAMNIIAERVKVTDPSGEIVDVKSALDAPANGGADPAASDAEDDDDLEDDEDDDLEDDDLDDADLEDDEDDEDDEDETGEDD
jgi:hypothetical protein